MVFLSEGAVTHWQMEQSPVLLPVSKANPRLRGQEHPEPPFCPQSWKSWDSDCHLALPTVPWLSWAYRSYPDCLCLQAWLCPRIPAGGENLFSGGGLINACSL